MFKLNDCVSFNYNYPEFPYDRFFHIDNIKGVEKSFVVDIKYVDNQYLYGIRTSSHLLKHLIEHKVLPKEYLNSSVPFESWTERNFFYGPKIVIRDTIIYVKDKDLISADWYGMPIEFSTENKFNVGDLVTVRRSFAGGICIMNPSHEFMFDKNQIKMGETLAIIIKITDSKALELIAQLPDKKIRGDLTKLNIKSKYNSWFYTYAESQDIIRRLGNINCFNCSNCLDYDKLASGQTKT